MSKIGHRIFVTSLVTIAISTVLFVGIYGFEYYSVPLAERHEHALHDKLGPTGSWGHGMGFIGSAMMIFGVTSYSMRKRMTALANFGRISHWLEFHIFLCLLGPALIVYHTAFKFGGIISVSFWSMVAVVSSGLIGRYLYAQIPKGIRGKNKSVQELQEENDAVTKELVESYNLDADTVHEIEVLSGQGSDAKRVSLLTTFPRLLVRDWKLKSALNRILKKLKSSDVSPDVLTSLRRVVLRKSKLQKKISTLEITKRLFHHWHIFHLPFAIIMFVIMVAHIIVAFLFGYRWIF